MQTDSEVQLLPRQMKISADSERNRQPGKASRSINCSQSSSIPREYSNKRRQNSPPLRSGRRPHWCNQSSSSSWKSHYRYSNVNNDQQTVFPYGSKFLSKPPSMLFTSSGSLCTRKSGCRQIPRWEGRTRGGQRQKEAYPSDPFNHEWTGACRCISAKTGSRNEKGSNSSLLHTKLFDFRATHLGISLLITQLLMDS